MKQRFLIITGLFLINLFSIIQAQSFTIVQKKDSTVVEVPLPLKAYSYNNFTITDSSLIISAPTKILDVIIADFTRDRRYFLNFTPTLQHIFVNNQTLEIGDKACVGIDLSQAETQHVLYFPSNTIWIYHQSMGEKITTHDRILCDSITLEPKMYHILQTTANMPGEYQTHVQLKRYGNIIENKEIKLTFLRANIKLACALEDIQNLDYSKEIKYKIESSKPLPTRSQIEVTFDILLNGKKQTIRDSVILLAGTTRSRLKMIFPFTGRCPRTFSVTNIYVSKYNKSECIDFFK